jgi:hypothetical protein
MRKENMAIRQVTAMMKEKLLGDDFLSLFSGCEREAGVTGTPATWRKKARESRARAPGCRKAEAIVDT